jgi:hypothetical protein
MSSIRELRIEPPAEILGASREWLAPVRHALGGEFLAAYLTGSVLTQGFDPKKSRVNILVVARELSDETVERLGAAIPREAKKRPGFEPLFVSRRQMEKSLDVFPIEWLEIQERHLLLEGEDLVAALQVPRTYLRLQCEQQLRGKFLHLRQGLLAHWDDDRALGDLLAGSASSFAALFRTLLRLRGETTPADTPKVIERVSDLYRLDAQGLLAAHLARYAGVRPGAARALTRSFLAQIERLIVAIDELSVP